MSNTSFSSGRSAIDSIAANHGDETLVGALRTLDWDSTHFGRRVGRIEGSMLNATALRKLLARARAEDFALVYFYTERGKPLDERLLACFGGAHVGGHVAYERALSAQTGSPAKAPLEGVSFERFMGPEDDPELIALGIASGLYSRFRMDPRLTQERCDAMYATWIRRSIRGELADQVLIARLNGRPAALLSFQLRDRAAEIGLVSTVAGTRGRGLGTALLGYAHQRMVEVGASASKVVTQSQNQPARRLYERVGYRRRALGDTYHFHLTAGD